MPNRPFSGINRCTDEEDEEAEEEGKTPNPNKHSSGFLDGTTSEMKRNAVYSMSVPEFFKLISKIESVHVLICKDVRDSYKMPKACEIWIKREADRLHRTVPFQEKHVLQQCSILGNFEDFGVLKHSVRDLGRDEQSSNEGAHGDDNGSPAVVEFGAGKGYLTQMLADCYGINRVWLVERKSYKLKADRSLRQKENLILERLRIDIEDLNLNAVESLRGVSYLAIGKHLCGPATDLTLRCCLKGQQHHDSAVQCNANPYLIGLAIATCCHHLCQWKHYINKRYLTNLGITKEDFDAITWFTSWAVDADHGSDLPDVFDCGFDISSIEKEDGCGNAGGVEEATKNMKAAERAVLGFMCKEIIDKGRLMWIKDRGLDTELIKYVPLNISPENHLLIARNSFNI
ncbi:uncharacterized protein LOC131156304 isoform X2 [Malania oleifera]|uniref:uncharacterized protein LOC131156304 isoform X2 n=1 Tax=Malania oleifera TaxID=397392 RepID=UPI0025AE5972|nr:uncharacterized protein LOC131156304 isoform X2 [Malania oleifera]